MPKTPGGAWRVECFISMMVMGEIARVMMRFVQQSHTLYEIFIRVFSGQRDRRGANHLRGWRPPQSMWRNVPAHHRAGFDDSSFPYSDIGQDDAVRTDEDILLDHDCPFMLNATRSPIEVGEDGCAKADGAVITDENAIGMTVVHVNKMREPDTLADLHSPQTMQPRSQTGSARANKRENMEKPT